MKTNVLGYPVLSDTLHEKVFGHSRTGFSNENALKRATSLLNKFGIRTPVDFPESLYDGDLPLPKLRGKDLREHFEKIAEEQIGSYKYWADKFSKCKLPRIPEKHEIIYSPGWTRYEWNWDKESFSVSKVDYPLEDAFTFDTETFVEGGSFPIIGTAVSEKAVYVWLASELLDPSLPEEQWDQRKLIPVGENKFIAGHNISYDRVRAQEGYSLMRNKPENFYFDTLSAHIGVSGLASGQRWLYLLAAKDPENLTEEEKRKLRYAPKWLDEGATNSLVQCYNFHVYEVRKYFGDESVRPLDQGDKKIRDIFVDATHMIQITAVLENAVEYAVKDAFYTAELFQSLWPKYLDSTPSLVGLCGHYHLNGSVVPLVSNWQEWVKGAEEVYHSYSEEMTHLCKKLLQETYEEWLRVFSSQEDPEAGLLEAEKWAKKDPWISQLDWEVKSKKGKYAWVPTWYRAYMKEPDKPIGVRSILAHLLLKLKYEGSPIYHSKESGWCYENEEGEMNKIPHPKGTGENVGGVLSKDFVQDMEVGRLSSDLPEAKRALEIANASSYWTSVRKRVMDRIYLSVKNPHGSDTLVTLPEILCHGTVTRRTVENLMATMCSTKSWRIGTELKTRIQAPEGWKVVSADYDGQELQIASIYSDKWESGIAGGSPMGYNVLSGSKENGTDPHTALARAILPEIYGDLVWHKSLGICKLYEEQPEDTEGFHKSDKGWLKPIDKKHHDLLKSARDLAKIVGFAILYGGSVRALSTPIRRVFPDKGEKEVKEFALKAISSKKGFQVKGVYEGGSDSGAFNLMEKISMKSKVPQLPCLGTKISTAMRPSAVGTDFKTGRTNWTIQASGAEILSITLTAVAWLAEEYKIPYRFIISIHDELHFMTPEKYSEQFAVLFQIAHMYTWALFHSSVEIPELPLSRAFFSSVAIDDRLRKSPKECTQTPSNLSGKEEPNGVEYSLTQLQEMGAIDKLQTRFNAIQKGLI
jgi:DNA polymerase gamma 1